MKINLTYCAPLSRLPRYLSKLRVDFQDGRFNGAHFISGGSLIADRLFYYIGLYRYQSQRLASANESGVAVPRDSSQPKCQQRPRLTTVQPAICFCGC